MIIVESVNNVTLDGVSDLGKNVVLRAGEKYPISEDIVSQTGTTILAELKEKKDSGDIKVHIIREKGRDYTAIDQYMEDRIDTFATGEGAPTSTIIAGVLLNTNIEAGTWSDITVPIIGADGASGGSAITIFPNPSATNASMFVGSLTPISGMDVQVRAAKNGGDSAVITAQYWDGSAWVDLRMMASDRKEPFTRRWVGSSMFSTTGAVSVWFDRNRTTSQVAKVLNGSASMYWVKFSIASGSIAASGITISRMRLHRNSTVFSATGARVNYGSARRGELFRVDLDKVPASDAAAVGNVSVSANVTVREAAVHATAVDTAIVGQMMIQPWMDVSSGITFGMVWKAVVATGTVKWRVTCVKVKDGATEGGALAEVSDLVTRTVPGANVVDKFIFARLDVSDLQSGDLVVIKVERVGTADTNAGAAHRREFQALMFRCVEGSGV